MRRALKPARDAGLPPPVSPLPPNVTVGKRWRFRRNVVIYIAYRAGVSQRVIADVFDLPRSRIGVIVKEMGALVGHREIREVL